MEILKVSDLHENELGQLEEIFWESSGRDPLAFSSIENKNKFQYKYFGYYKEKYPEFFLVGKRDSDILGYICGANRLEALNELTEFSSYLSEFEDEFKMFPAHLHINLHKNSRGLGLGSILIKSFEELLKMEDIIGLHLITSPDARNKSFYLKNNFDYMSQKNHGELTLLLLGKTLKSIT